MSEIDYAQLQKERKAKYSALDQATNIIDNYMEKYQETFLEKEHRVMTEALDSVPVTEEFTTLFEPSIFNATGEVISILEQAKNIKEENTKFLVKARVNYLSACMQQLILNMKSADTTNEKQQVDPFQRFRSLILNIMGYNPETFSTDHPELTFIDTMLLKMYNERIKPSLDDPNIDQDTLNDLLGKAKQIVALLRVGPEQPAQSKETYPVFTPTLVEVEPTETSDTVIHDELDESTSTNETLDTPDNTDDIDTDTSLVESLVMDEPRSRKSKNGSKRNSKRNDLNLDE